MLRNVVVQGHVDTLQRLEILVNSSGVELETNHLGNLGHLLIFVLKSSLGNNSK